MNVLVLQHEAVEHLGVLAEFLREDNAVWRTVELDEGESIPDLTPFDLMIVMGGEQDVWQEDQYPWLRNEKAAIRKFVVGMRRSFLGICLGHQLLAEAVGGRVQSARMPERGVLPVSMTPEGKLDPIMRNLQDPMTVFEWHGAEVVALPPDARILARTDACHVQAFRYGGRAYGVQFHIEVTKNTIADWAPASRMMVSPRTEAELAVQVNAALSDLNHGARTLYENLKTVWAGPSHTSEPRIARPGFRF